MVDNSDNYYALPCDVAKVQPISTSISLRAGLCQVSWIISAAWIIITQVHMQKINEEINLVGILLPFRSTRVVVRAVPTHTLGQADVHPHITVDIAVAWLTEHRPKDDEVSQGFLRAHAQAAVNVRNAFGFASAVPVDLFFDFVLPYAHFDEEREEWRSYFFSRLEHLLTKDMSLSEAAQAVQRGIFSAFDEPAIKFKANSTPECLAPLSETIKNRYASCTGLSILLANGLRSCGIPARVAGIARWNRLEGGNHNWVEAWFDEKWNFIDAAPGESEWNRAWFQKEASKSIRNSTLHGIYVPSWNEEQATNTYTITWRNAPLQIPALDRTAFYQQFPIS